MRRNNLKISDFVLFVFIFFFFFLSLCFSYQAGEQQFVSLAESFLKGKLYFIDQLPNWMDTTLFNGKYYWPLGPFPSVLLVPFVLIFQFTGFNLVQGYVSIVMVGIIIYWIYKLGILYCFSKQDSLYLAYAFCFASAFLPMMLLSWSWHFSHVITVFLLWWSIWEYLNKKRYWLIGTIIGMAILTRLTSIVWTVFFILSIFADEKEVWLNKIHQSARLLLPIMIGLIIFGVYNFSRFGNFFDQGYVTQNIWYLPLIKAREQGLLSLVHVPGNLYYLLFALPLFQFPYLRADPWGMSIFITSPYLLYLFRAKYNDKLSKIIIITIVLVIIPMLLYYGIGWRQVGYRYALDFFPFIFWLYIIKKAEKTSVISLGLKRLIIISSIINLYFFFNVFQ